MKSMRSVIVLAAVGVAVAGGVVMRSSRSEEVITPRGEEVAMPRSEEAKSPRSKEVATPAALTFIELGSERCASCRAMIPVLETLRTGHCDLNVRFIDVWDDPAGGKAFNVTTIPTQVLLAPDGHELARHMGFWSANAIRAAFASHGHPLTDPQGSCTP